MDRPIPQREQKTAKLKKLLLYGAGAVLLGVLFFWGREWVKPKLDSDKFYTAKVEFGAIDQTINASGTIVPGFEREINAPVNTEIKKVLRRNGESVKAGDIILELDEEFTKLEYERLKDELALRQNNVGKLKLEFDKALRELEYRDQIKGMEIGQLESQVANQSRLLNIGGGTQEELKDAQLRLEIGKLEKKLLENELDYKRKVNHTEKQNLELEYQIQLKHLQQLERKLNETVVRAPGDGVITWVNEDIGRRVNEGEPLVKIADLDRYEVEAATSDRNAQQITPGMPAKVKIGNTLVEGRVLKTLPAVENNTIKFLVALPEEQSASLRPNMRVDVYLITDQKADVLKLRNGPAFNGAPNQRLYVVRNGMAYATDVRKGLNNADYVEILSGLQEGDEVIISSTEDFDHLDEVELKNLEQ